MNCPTPSLFSRRPFGVPSFALISVLALVSLAALTATAFLASARLERTATRPLGQSVRLEMALNIGMNCAKEVINDGLGQSYNNIATCWRTNLADDNGYLLMGTPQGTTDSKMYWYAAFSTAQMTTLHTNLTLITNRVSVTNQSMFSNTISTFMNSLTNVWPNGSTNIELIGHTAANPCTSPPVGWITIMQPVRTTPGSTNTSDQPVIRFAFFVQDLSGLIDAERMCGNPNRGAGTNPTEISMANILVGANTNGIPFGTNINTRATYLSPFLLASNGGIATTNLRYFATGLRSWTNAPPRIPRSITVYGSTMYGGILPGPGLKINLNTDTGILTANTNILTIAGALTTNLPTWTTIALNPTNRSGGMNGTTYCYALAANIIDYADTNPAATTAPPVPTVRGFDNYPMLTHVFDSFVYSQSPPTITITTYLQFWNPSSIPTPALTGGTFTYRLNDTIMYTDTAGIVTTRPLTNSALAISSFTFGGGSNSFTNNSGYITSITNTINLASAANFPNFPTTAPPSVQLNGSAATNSFTLTGLGVTSQPPIVLYRGTTPNTLNNGVPSWIGSVLGSRMSTGEGNAGSSLLSADPRMLNYIGVGTTKKMADAAYTNVYWGGYPAEYTTAYLSGHPGNWPDSTNSTNVTPNGTKKPIATPPTTGGFTIPDPAPCKLSTNGYYTNICELGNVFDPIQWAPPAAITNYANCDITTNWTTNTLYGGGSTLRIGRPEHSRFAFTNIGGSATGLPVPNMGQSAAALLDIFCVTNTYDDGGKINLNTAPGPVLAALAGGITLNRDPNQAGLAINATMVTAFTNGVMRFRKTYPFYSTSQLPFISANYGSSAWTNSWINSTVFSTNALGGGLAGITSVNDEGLEEWFSKIYGLTSVESRNFRIYVYAQMVTSNNVPYGRVMRKYYQVYAQQKDPGATSGFTNANYSMIPERESEY